MEEVSQYSIKYRPTTFEDIYGQKEIIKSIQKRIKDNNYPQAILLQGQYGTGKCLTGNSVVVTNEGLRHIKDIKRHAQEGFSDLCIEVNNAESSDMTSHFYKEKVNNTIEIQLENGSLIEGTYAHPLYVIGADGYPTWKSLQDIELEDVVICRHNTRSFGNDQVFKYHFIPSKFDTLNKEHFYEIPLNFEIGKFLGYIVANGSVDNNIRLQFCTSNERIFKDFKNIYLKYFGGCNSFFRESFDILRSPKILYNASIGKASSCVLKAMYDFENQNFPTARFKKVPDCVLNGNEDLQRGFLIGMYECDAYFNGHGLELSSASKNIYIEILSMLKNIGLLVTGRIRFNKKYNRDYYNINIDRQSIIELYEGYSSLKYSFNFSGAINPNKRSNYLPQVVWDDYKNWKVKNINGAGMYKKDTSKRYISIDNLNQASKKKFLSESIAEVLYKNLPEDNNLLTFYSHKFMKLGWRTFRVIKKDYLSEEKFVYDLTIPESHNFIANGIISHNTTLGLITAAAMNCHFEDGNPDWSNPDNKAILNQTFDRDTLLFDASRWSGKDAMVEFTSIMKTRPLYSTSGLRIFIIEEIDQASSAAKLALLKILEKPDPFNKFILLSMEPNGVPQSIKSRCQVYNFKPISIRDTMYALKSIMEKTGDWNNENIPNEFRTEGLAAIASNSKGSLRVAIQNLEACIEGEIYTKEGIEDLIGVVDEASTMTILRGLLDKTSDKIIWSNIYKADPQELYNYLTLILSNVMIYRMTGYMDDDRFEDSTKVMANHENLFRLFDILTTHPQLCKPYMRKCDLLSALAEYYKNTIDSREKGERLMENIAPSVPVRRIIKNGT